MLVFDEAIGGRGPRATPAASRTTPSSAPRSSCFGRGVLLSLADIPPGGASVCLLGREHGKSVYRLSVHTRAREVFDLAVNVAEEMNSAELRQEVAWLLAAGAPPPLVEAVRRLLTPNTGIFTEEYIPGEDVERQVDRLLRQGEAARLRALWPFLVWGAAGCTSGSGTAPGEGSPCASPRPRGLHRALARLPVRRPAGVGLRPLGLHHPGRGPGPVSAGLRRPGPGHPARALSRSRRPGAARRHRGGGRSTNAASPCSRRRPASSRRALAMQGLIGQLRATGFTPLQGLLRGPPLPPLAGG